MKLRLIPLAALLAFPLVALAQVADAVEPDFFDSLLRYVPIKWWMPFFLVYFATYYVVAPQVKKIKLDEQSPVWKRYLVAAAEWFTQDSHRPPKTPPKGFAILPVAVVFVIAILSAWLLWPRSARAADLDPVPVATVTVVTTPDAPFTFQLTPDLSLHLNVSVVAFSYDLTNRAYLGQVPVTGLYALTSRKLLDSGIAAGGSVSFDTSSRPSGEVNAGAVGPRIAISPQLSLHVALLYGRRFGANAANLLRLAPTLEF